MRLEGVRRPRDPELSGVAERAPIARRLQPQCIGIRDPVAAVQREGHGVEIAAVVQRATPTSRPAGASQWASS